MEIKMVKTIEIYIWLVRNHSTEADESHDSSQLKSVKFDSFTLSLSTKSECMICLEAFGLSVFP